MLLLWLLSEAKSYWVLVVGFMSLVIVLFELKIQTSPEGPSKDARVSRSFPSPSIWLSARSSAWLFLFRGPEMIQQAYDKSKGTFFHIDVPENRYLVVSSQKHIKEIDSAPHHVLSLQGAAEEILQPQHTMAGFNWLEKRGAEGAPLIRTLRTLLTNHLPDVLPDIKSLLSRILQTTVSEAQDDAGTEASFALYPMVVKAVSRSNALAFFGPDLARNEAFLKAAIDFIEQTLVIAEIIRLLPESLVEPVSTFLQKRLTASRIIFSTLEPIAAQRLEQRAQAVLGHRVPEHKDCIQWVMESSQSRLNTKPWTAGRIVHELIALWFGSVHITSTTLCFAIHDLCLHPGYLAPLRREVETVGWESFYKSQGNGFPLLDSFIKESARLTPVESVSTRRKALQPFAFSDGLTVPAGEWVCTAARGMVQEETYCPDAGEFRGFRFSDMATIASTVTGDTRGYTAQPGFTNIADWQIWGTGRCAW
ncbi:putative cytochrome P450 E-class, group IV [Naviculisporaceae sp. PSN 640]